jgi:hypothetical protein
MQPLVTSQNAYAPTPDPSGVIAHRSKGNEHDQISGYGNGYQVSTHQTFSRLPHRTPVDMQFENIGFTARLGFRKGKAF